jgi:predicted Zn-dependent peptidase
MFKKSLLFFLLLIFFSLNAAQFRGYEKVTLEGGKTNVIFVNTTDNENVLFMLIVRGGSNEELDKQGISNLLCSIFTQKLRDNVKGDTIQYGSEISSISGNDRNIYFLYSTKKNLSAFISNIGNVFKAFDVTQNDIDKGKAAVGQEISEASQIDRKVMRKVAMESVYLHSNSGLTTMGDLDNLNLFTAEDVKGLQRKQQEVNIVVVGNVDKTKTLEEISKYFGKAVSANAEISTGTKQEASNDAQNTEEDVTKTEAEVVTPSSTNVGLVEPPHHGSTVKVTRYSNQIHVPLVEMFWRIPVYKNNKKEARAAEVFVNYLKKTLDDRLESMGISRLDFSYSFWGRENGDLEIAFTVEDPSRIDEAITAVITEINRIVSEGVTERQAREVITKLADAEDLFNYRTDSLDFAGLLGQRLGAGYDIEDLKSHPEFIRKCDLESIDTQGKAIFGKEPCVVTVMMPMRLNGMSGGQQICTKFNRFPRKGHHKPHRKRHHDVNEMENSGIARETPGLEEPNNLPKKKEKASVEVTDDSREMEDRHGPHRDIGEYLNQWFGNPFAR